MPPHPTGHSPQSAPEPVPHEAVREQLTRILASSGFVSSARLCRFLTHVVERTLEGDPESLKEFAIALEVFDRTAEYDPNVDAIVRVEARRLRTKLKAYYETASDLVRIELRPGSYVPTFRWLHAQPAPDRAHGAQPQGKSSVAVLPFVNMSPDPEQEYFCDGISEEIIDSLTRVPGLNVIARTSAFQFKGVSVDVRGVGQKLGADLVIEGSVRKAHDQVRITAQAVETVSGHHLWSKTFRREFRDIFAIQEEIANVVADLLRVHAPARPEQSRNSEAYTEYLGARFLIHQQTPEALRAAVQQLQRLIAKFPDYAPAHSGVAAALGLLAIFGAVSGREVYAQVKESAERGYALDPDSAETCTMLGGLRAWFEHRWEDAAKLSDRALQLQPGHATSYIFRGMTALCQGNINAAEAALMRAIELDPLSASDCARMAYLYYVKGDDTALDYLERSFELNPDYPESRFYEGLLHFQRGDYERVEARLSTSSGPLDLGVLAATYGRWGRRRSADACVEKLRTMAERQFVTPLGEGLAAIGMGDFDMAFQKLHEAIKHRTNFVNLVAVDPFFEPLRGDSRFPKVLKALRLPA